MRPAGLLDAARFAVATDAAKFYINNAASFQFDRGESVPRIVDAFVETDRRLNLRLQLRMRINIVPIERLLHHQEPKFIQLSQMGSVFEPVGGIGVNGKQ